MAKSDKFYLRQLSNELIRKPNASSFFSKVRENVPTTSFGFFVDELKRHPSPKSSILGKRTGSNVKDLDNIMGLTSLDIESELKWSKAVFSRNTDVIEEYIKLSKKYSLLLMSGDYKKAKEVLNSIESRFGPSLWLIKNRIAFLQLTEGLEAQKRFTQNIKDKAKYRGFIAYITHWVSIRNEETTTAIKFISQFQNVLTKEAKYLDKGYIPYLKYHILNMEDLKLEEVCSILSLDFSRSLIDYYESFVCAGRVILLKGSDTDKAQLLYCLKKFVYKIPDERLHLLMSLLNQPSANVSPLKDSIACYDKFPEGNYAEALIEASKGLEKEPTNPSLICLSAFCKSMINDSNGVKKDDKPINTESLNNPLHEILIEKLSDVVSGGVAGAPKQTNDLIKMGMNFSSVLGISAPSVIINKEFVKRKISDNSTLLSSLKVPSLDPFLIPVFDNSNILNEYTNRILEMCTKSPSISYSLAFVNKETIDARHYCDEASLSLKGNLAYSSESYQDAYKYGESLVKSPISFYQRQGHQLVARSLLTLKNYKATCRYIADHFIHQQHLYSIFPIAEVVKELPVEGDEWYEVRGLIALSIILDAYTKYIGKEFSSQRTYAYEDFLESHGVDRPSQLLPKLHLFDKTQFIYFLKFICIESIMDTSTKFDYPSQVSAERLAVCRLLVEIDPVNKDEYQQEIKDLIRKDVINKKMKEIDESRIYIDIEKLKEWGFQELQEGFDRYKEYLRHGLDEEVTSKREEAK